MNAPIPFDATEILDREFLEVRARILQIAASLDRIGRATGDVRDDPRLHTLHTAIRILNDTDANRAEQIQMIFSLEYDDAWRDTFNSQRSKK